MKQVYLLLHEAWAKVLPVALTYACSGLAAALATVCSLTFDTRR